MRHATILAAALALVAQGAAAHDGVKHASPAEANSHIAETETAPPAPTPLPFDLGGAFELVDQTGEARGEADPEGRPQLLFFGYANCPGICSSAMPLMASVADRLAARGTPLRPIMVTIDPDRDTVENMRLPLAEIHPDFVGLTGTPEALDHVYDLFSIDIREMFVDPEYGPIYAHGSHIYLLDGQGEVLTLIPPILSPGRAAEIVAGYVAE